MPAYTYMLDTNVFNHVLDGRINIDDLDGLTFAATHIQSDELRNTKDEIRRAKLLGIFSRLIEHPEPTNTFVAGVSVAGGARVGSGGMVPTESAIWGVSRWGEAKWGVGDGIFTGMRQELDALNKGKRNNVHDALIAETAIRNNFILITSDSDLFLIATKYGGACGNIFILKSASKSLPQTTD